jgi:hypothetical protein
MYCTDFEYDNQKLSDYGCVVCHFSSNSDLNTMDIGSQITFNTIHQRDKFKKMSTKYESAYTTTFEIGKMDCANPDEHTFSQEEVSAIMRWLNKKQYKKFKMTYRDGEFANVYYMGAFNVKMITYAGNIVGFELTLQTDAPYGYYDEIECEMDFLIGTEQLSIFDISDEIGFVYPKDVKIECYADGELSIHNSQDGLRSTVIRNCIAGEILTLDGENKIITSSENHEKLYNDFNYNYIRISNKNESTIDDIQNIFTVSLPCKISFTYSPICKAGIV